MNAADILVWALKFKLARKPLYAKRLEHLERFPDDQVTIAFMQKVLEDCFKRQSQGDIVAWHPDSTCGISGGDTPVAFELETKTPVRFDFASTPQQPYASVMSAIVGRQKSGKTTLGAVLMRGIAKLDGVAVWAIDPNNVLHRLLESDIDRFAVLRPGVDIRFQPCAPVYLSQPVSDDEYLREANKYFDLTVEAFGAQYSRQDSRYLLNEVMPGILQDSVRHWRPNKRKLPSYSAIAELLKGPLPDSLGKGKNTWKMRDFASGLAGVLQQLDRGTCGLFDTSWSNALPALLSQNIIFDTSDMDVPGTGYFLLWLITFLQRYAANNNWFRDGRMHLFLLVDDLQQLLAAQNSPLPDYLNVLRQRGIHLCAMVHNFSSLSRLAEGDIDLACLVGPLAGADQQAFIRWANLDPTRAEVRTYLSGIQNGCGLTRHIRHPWREVLPVRYLELHKQDVDDATIERVRKTALSGITFDPPLTADELTGTTFTASTPSGPTSVPLTNDERVRKFLESVAQPLGWTQPQYVHLNNAGVGNSKELREQLLRDLYGLVHRYDKVNNGRGSGIALFELSDEGWRKLGRTPVAIPGKGTLPHKFYQENTVQVLGRALPGYPAAQREYRIGGHLYDLMQAMLSGKLVGIEIAASEQDRNEVANAIDGFLPHTGRICAHAILAASDAAFRRVTADIDGAVLLRPVRARIYIVRIGEFWSNPRAFLDRWTR